MRGEIAMSAAKKAEHSVTDFRAISLAIFEDAAIRPLQPLPCVAPPEKEEPAQGERLVRVDVVMEKRCQRLRVRTGEHRLDIGIELVL